MLLCKFNCLVLGDRNKRILIEHYSSNQDIYIATGSDF